MFENISKSDITIVCLIALLTVVYIWHEYFREDKTTAAIGRLERQQAAVKSADKKVEARVATFENTRKNNDAKILQARRGAAESVRALDTAGVVDGLRNELAWIRGRDRYGNLGEGRERGTHPAGGKGSATRNPDVARRERGADLLARIGEGGHIGGYSGGAGIAGTDTTGTPPLAGNDNAAPKTAERGETEDEDSWDHRPSGNPCPGALKVDF